MKKVRLAGENGGRQKSLVWYENLELVKERRKPRDFPFTKISRERAFLTMNLR